MGRGKLEPQIDWTSNCYKNHYFLILLGRIVIKAINKLRFLFRSKFVNIFILIEVIQKIPITFSLKYFRYTTFWNCQVLIFNTLRNQTVEKFTKVFYHISEKIAWNVPSTYMELNLKRVYKLLKISLCELRTFPKKVS